MVEILYSAENNSFNINNVQLVIWKIITSKKETCFKIRIKSINVSNQKWKFEALIQFLVSNEWKITILNFVDNNCIVFDNEEENKF